MCGLAGYAGKKAARPFLVEAIKRLEYRGYDSWGLAIFAEGKVAEYTRQVGRIGETDPGSPTEGKVGLAHTRWATHGEVRWENTHPIQGVEKLPFPGAEVLRVPTVYVIHNGVVDNHIELREELFRLGHEFKTDTDTEVIAHLLADAFHESMRAGSISHSHLAFAAQFVLKRLKGKNAFVAHFTFSPDTLVAACHESPIVISPDGHICSEPQALAGFSKSYKRLPDVSVAIVRAGEVSFYNNGVHKYDPTFPEPTPAVLVLDGGPLMRREIEEQVDLFVNYAWLGDCVPETFTSQPLNAVLFGCGSSYHAALLGRHFFEKLAGIPTSAEYATEFATGPVIERPFTAYVGLTQSGETRDTLNALERVRESVLPRSVVVTNNPGSAATHLALPSPLNCGPERGVAATKTFTAQVLRLLNFACVLGGGNLAERMIPAIADMGRSLRDWFGDIDDDARRFAKQAVKKNHLIFLGRGLLYPVALEGALKVKEVAYKHAEAIHSSEIKHGPIALLDENVLCVFLLTGQDIHHEERVLGNISEVRARKCPGMVFADQVTQHKVAQQAPDWPVIVLPAVNPWVQPVLVAVALQLFAYHLAVLQGIDPDFPRNLSKTVTVE